MSIDIIELRRGAARPQALSVPRQGVRPATTDSNPHVQLEQNAPHHLQDALHAHVRRLPGVVVERSHISLPGARGFSLSPRPAAAPTDGFLVGDEFAHLHPPSDGSLHLVLPPWQIGQVLKLGWGELHPVAAQYGMPLNVVMLYGPRDERELVIASELLTASWAYASGLLPSRLP